MARVKPVKSRATGWRYGIEEVSVNGEVFTFVVVASNYGHTFHIPYGDMRLIRGIDRRYRLKNVEAGSQEETANKARVNNLVE